MGMAMVKYTCKIGDNLKVDGDDCVYKNRKLPMWLIDVFVNDVRIPGVVEFDLEAPDKESNFGLGTMKVLKMTEEGCPIKNKDGNLAYEVRSEFMFFKFRPVGFPVDEKDQKTA
jgi:hypothetical protein